MIDPRPPVPRDEMLRRISGEYLEMPELRLTCEQAQRLWGLDHETCVELLAELVSQQFLTRTPNGLYARVAAGSPSIARRRMAQAALRASTFSINRVS